jgi:hypothetical protein
MKFSCLWKTDEEDNESSGDDSDSEPDDEPMQLTDAESELDLTVPKAEGRRSTRTCAAPASFGYTVSSQSLQFSSDSDRDRPGY